jgi:hypothetical protein
MRRHMTANPVAQTNRCRLDTKRNVFWTIYFCRPKNDRSFVGDKLTWICEPT